MTGTFGHHWKEFTAGEIHQYFQTLSSDWSVTRLELIDVRIPDPSLPAIRALFPVPEEELDRDNLFVEVTLTAKARGITVSPPWIPDYPNAARADADRLRARVATLEPLAARRRG